MGRILNVKMLTPEMLRRLRPMEPPFGKLTEAEQYADTCSQDVVIVRSIVDGSWLVMALMPVTFQGLPEPAGNQTSSGGNWPRQQDPSAA